MVGDVERTENIKTKMTWSVWKKKQDVSAMMYIKTREHIFFCNQAQLLNAYA